MDQEYQAQVRQLGTHLLGGPTTLHAFTCVDLTRKVIESFPPILTGADRPRPFLKTVVLL